MSGWADDLGPVDEFGPLDPPDRFMFGDAADYGKACVVYGRACNARAAAARQNGAVSGSEHSTGPGAPAEAATTGDAL